MRQKVITCSLCLSLEDENHVKCLRGNRNAKQKASLTVPSCLANFFLSNRIVRQHQAIAYFSVTK